MLDAVQAETRVLAETGTSVGLAWAAVGLIFIGFAAIIAAAEVRARRDGRR